VLQGRLDPGDFDSYCAARWSGSVGCAVIRPASGSMRRIVEGLPQRAGTGEPAAEGRSSAIASLLSFSKETPQLSAQQPIDHDITQAPAPDRPAIAEQPDTWGPGRIANRPGPHVPPPPTPGRPATSVTSVTSGRRTRPSTCRTQPAP
jgi:hypothetical protein